MPLIYCRLCKNIYPDLKSLDQHIRNEHSGFVRCDVCDTILREERSEAHRWSEECIKNLRREQTKYPLKKRKLNANHSLLPAGFVYDASNDKTFVESKGKMAGTGKCHECGKIAHLRWRYSKSTHIEDVYICSKCKNAIAERSSRGSRDAMIGAISGGAFDSNRRKH